MSKLIIFFKCLADNSLTQKSHRCYESLAKKTYKYWSLYFDAPGWKDFQTIIYFSWGISFLFFSGNLLSYWQVWEKFKHDSSRLTASHIMIFITLLILWFTSKFISLCLKVIKVAYPSYETTSLLKSEDNLWMQGGIIKLFYSNETPIPMFLFLSQNILLDLIIIWQQRWSCWASLF